MQQEQLLPTQVPNFQLNINDEHLQNLLKDMQFALENQALEMERLKKQVEKKPSQFLISEANIMLSGEVDIDPMLGRLVKVKEKKKSEETSVIKKSARDFGKKLNLLAEAVNYLFEQSKAQDKRLINIETQLPKDISEKNKSIEKRLDQVRQSFALDVTNLTERLEVRHHEQSEQVREVEKKTLWQINDCKVNLETRINEQYVKDAMRQLQQKVTNRMKEHQVRSNIDPDRVIKLQGRIAKLDNDYSLNSVELSQKIKTLAEKMELSLLTKSHFNEDRVELEKRIVQLNGYLSDINRRISGCESNSSESTATMKSLSQQVELTDRQVLLQITQIKRVNEVLKHMKLGEQFQRMIEKLDPHKICEMDGQIETLNFSHNRLEKECDAIKKQIDKLRSKNSFVGSLQPTGNGGGTINSTSKMRREDVEEVVNECLVNNMYFKKIPQLESAVADFKLSGEQLINMEKRMNKMQKESELHNMTYQMKGLEEYVKREILMLSNRLTQLQSQFKEETRNRQTRPTSATKTLLNSRSNSAVNVKKLHPVNCIGCYETPAPGLYGPMNDNGSDTYSRVKTFTAIGSRR